MKKKKILHNYCYYQNPSEKILRARYTDDYFRLLLHQSPFLHRKRLEVASPDDLFLVIAGSGHIDHRMGVPERVDRYGIVAKEHTCIITVR